MYGVSIPASAHMSRRKVLKVAFEIGSVYNKQVRQCICAIVEVRVCCVCLTYIIPHVVSDYSLRSQVHLRGSIRRHVGQVFLECTNRTKKRIMRGCMQPAWNLLGSVQGLVTAQCALNARISQVHTFRCYFSYL